MNTPNTIRTRDDSGVVAIEFVLVAPLLVALIFAIASFGLWFSKDVQVTGDARAVARQIAVSGPAWTPAMASSLLSGETIQSYTTCPANDTTDNASVALTYDGSALISIPGVPLSPPAITSTATMRCGG